MGNWEAHQRAVLEAERKLNQSLEQGTGGERKEKVNTKISSSKSKPGVPGGLKDVLKASINRLLSKISEKDTKKDRVKSKVETLLEESRKTKIKEQHKEESFLDKLIETYSTKERENALKSVGNDDYILRLLEGRRNEKIINELLSRERSRTFRRKKNEERLSLLDDFDLPPRRHPSQISSLSCCLVTILTFSLTMMIMIMKKTL